MTNLYNLADGKTKYVLRYIKDIEVPIGFGIKESEKLEKIKKEALKPGLTANEMLEIIGYSPTGPDAIMEG